VAAIVKSFSNWVNVRRKRGSPLIILSNPTMSTEGKVVYFPPSFTTLLHLIHIIDHHVQSSYRVGGRPALVCGRRRGRTASRWRSPHTYFVYRNLPHGRVYKERKGSRGVSWKSHSHNDALTPFYCRGHSPLFLGMRVVVL
jgi:hypothetical protein